MASIEKAELKIATHQETIDGLRQQKDNCTHTTYAAQGGEQYLKKLAAELQGFINGVDADFEKGDLTDKDYSTVKTYCARMLNMTLSSAMQAGRDVIAMKGKVSAVDDSIRVVERMVKAEELKIEAEKRKLEEAAKPDLCVLCEYVPADDEEQTCERCRKYQKKYKKAPRPELVEKWKAKDGFQDS